MNAREEFPCLDPFEAVVVSRESGPEACTIAPSDVLPCRQSTTWLTASADSYCSLVEMR